MHIILIILIVDEEFTEKKKPNESPFFTVALGALQYVQTFVRVKNLSGSYGFSFQLWLAMVIVCKCFLVGLILKVLLR